MRTNQQIFGDVVRGYRKGKGFTAEKLAKLSNIDRTYISKIERGKHTPDISVVERMSHALNEPALVTLYLRQNLPQIDDYYRKKSGPDSLTKTVLIDIHRGLSDREILNTFPKSIWITKQKDFLKFIQELRKVNQKFEKFSKNVFKSTMFTNAK